MSRHEVNWGDFESLDVQLDLCGCYGHGSNKTLKVWVRQVGDDEAHLTWLVFDNKEQVGAFWTLAEAVERYNELP